ncbi:MAG: XdhC family protein, partial [Chloroflexi bacterium]|nr:XdhC family protein [Chloroflexota bacterium]
LNECSSEVKMREVFVEVEAWRAAGKPVAIATNVKREGSSLRPLGAKMAMTTQQEIAGSVTGGCIEGVVYEEAQGVMKSGTPKLLHYGVVGDENPWEVGLSCGGSLDVFVETREAPGWVEIYPSLKTCLEQGQLAAVATVIAGAGLGNKLMLWPDGRTLGSLGSAALDEQAAEWMQAQIAVQETTWKAFTLAGETVDVFVDVFAPLSRLVVIGAVHIAIPLVTLGKALGYHTIVIDPREAFATRERFPHVDELLTDWPSIALEKLRPDEGTYIAVISHDEKLDNPALAVALKSPARYVGVLGTRKKIPLRFAALRDLGVSDEQLGRLRAPIGMNIGAVLPDEIALSILAEMVSAKHGMPASGNL